MARVGVYTDLLWYPNITGRQTIELFAVTCNLLIAGQFLYCSFYVLDCFCLLSLRGCAGDQLVVM